MMVLDCNSSSAGPRLGISIEGDLVGEWNGFGRGQEDAPSCLGHYGYNKLNRLEVFKAGLEQATQRAEGARDAQ